MEDASLVEQFEPDFEDQSLPLVFLHCEDSFTQVVEMIKRWLPKIQRSGRLAVHHALTSTDIGAAVVFFVAKTPSVTLELAAHRIAILKVKS